jgi:hypothetical protein
MSFHGVDISAIEQILIGAPIIGQDPLNQLELPHHGAVETIPIAGSVAEIKLKARLEQAELPEGVLIYSTACAWHNRASTAKSGLNGSWESAASGHDLKTPPQEQRQKKLDAFEGLGRT